MNSTILELSNEFLKLREAHAAAEAEVKRINEEWIKVEKDLLEAMVEDGLKGFDLDGVGRLAIRVTKVPSVNADSKPDFFEYLRATGHGGLIKEDVHSRTLSSFLRKHVEELQAQIQETGLTLYQQSILLDAGIDRLNGKLLSSATKDWDAMDASQLAAEILKAQGAAIYEKRDIQFKESK